MCSTPDDPSKRGGQDRDRISIEQDHELRYWTEKLGVSAEELKAAIIQVGDRVDKVEAFLQHNR